MADEISDLKEGNGGEALEGNVYEEVSIMVARLLIRRLQNAGKEIYKCNKYILHEMRQQRKTFNYNLSNVYSVFVKLILLTYHKYFKNHFGYLTTCGS